MAKQGPEELTRIEDIAFHLGIQKADFYLKLWATSKKENKDIYRYLLPCEDIAAIKK